MRTLCWISIYQHRIPKTEETVLFLHGNAVCLQHLFSVIKRGDQHEKRAFGEVEVGDERVYCLEFVAGIDENARLAAHGMDHTILVRHALDGAARGGAHADEPSARRASGIDDIGAFL